jgi:hypothetical protein
MMYASFIGRAVIIKLTRKNEREGFEEGGISGD